MKMMKSVMIAAAALAMTATVATAADRPTIVGYSEYAAEAKTFELGTGAEFILGDAVILTPMLIGSGTSSDFDFTRVEVKASYGLNENVDLYTKVKTDADLNYDELVVGASFQF
jgi:opacity protein-like surface antigen